MPGSPYYKIAAKVTNWLSVLSEWKCNSTKDMAGRLGNLELENGEVLVYLTWCPSTLLCL